MTIIGGFGIAAYMIQLSSITWSEHPVITTLDSITAPIDDVQFPTITVCSADQPDTWAFLENVLNNVAVECDNDKDCQKTNQLRQDFQYIFESIGDLFEVYLYSDHFNDTKELIVSDDFLTSWIHSNGFTTPLRAMLDKTENEKFNVIELYKFSEKHIAMGDYAVEKMENLINGSALEYYKKYKLGYDEQSFSKYCPTNLDECKKVVAMWKLIYGMAYSKVKFGTLLKNTVFMKDFVSFGMKNKIGDIQNRFGLWPFSDVCQTLSSSEKNLHKYFKSLSRLAGFKDSEQVSIHDLPSMLSSRIDGTEWPPVMSHLFLFSLCEENSNSENDYSYYSDVELTPDMFDLHASCIHEWYQYFQGNNSITTFPKDITCKTVSITLYTLFKDPFIHVRTLISNWNVATNGPKS